MQLQQLYFWSKKIHKWLLWFVTILGLWMMLSGYLMHKELEGEALLQTDWMIIMRFWHNKVSQIFLVVFGLQMLTGLAMWLFPKILNRRAVKPNTPQPVVPSTESK